MFGSDSRSRQWLQWSFVFLLSPLIILVVYLLIGLNGELASYQFRDYSVTERLLTQSTVLQIYLKNILVPHLSAFSLFNDDYPISTSLITPPYTLISVILTAVIPVIALIKRKTNPVFSFGILWFFGGHILESSHLNLEMYFDHRNYLPAFGIIFLLNRGFFYFYDKFKIIISVGGLIYYSIVLSITILSTSLWSSPVEQMRVVINAHPNSVRANTYLLSSYIKSHDLVHAKQEIHNIAIKYPGDIYPYLMDISVNTCLESNRVSEYNWKKLNALAETARNNGFDIVTVLYNMTFMAINGYCNNLDKSALSVLIKKLVDNDNYMLSRPHLYEIVASLLLNLGQYDEYVKIIKTADQINTSIPNKLSHIENLLSIGKHNEAENLLYSLKTYLKQHKRMAFAYHVKLDELEKKL